MGGGVDFERRFTWFRGLGLGLRVRAWGRVSGNDGFLTIGLPATHHRDAGRLRTNVPEVDFSPFQVGVGVSCC